MRSRITSYNVCYTKLLRTGGTPLWSEAQTVSVTKGIYNVTLGLNPFPPDLRITSYNVCYTKLLRSSGRGIYALSTGTGGVGVLAEASNTGDFLNYGGVFIARGTNGRGVYGEAPATGYAGYFSGRVLMKVP